MEINVIDEYNDKGHLIFCDDDYVGAFVRGKNRDEALAKLKAEIIRYAKWANIMILDTPFQVLIVQTKKSELQIEDADSDIIFHNETHPLTTAEYIRLKHLTLKSAEDFLLQYRSVPNKVDSYLKARQTFYGAVPLTAEQMYRHCKNVNAYYFGEIEVEAQNEPDIYTSRAEAFALLEQKADYLSNKVYEGSYAEQWSLRKLCRRFIWHDRIHAKAMYRMATKLCGPDQIANPFFF